MEPLIKVQDLHKVYNPGENEVRALDGISLEIEKGEFIAIIGHSGSGKSTLMNMLGCLDTPTSGSYFLNGTDISRLSDNALSEIRNKEIGFIFQGFNLVANLDAIGNVELPLIYRGLSKHKRRTIAVRALKKVGLEKRMKHKPNELSGGQQQRVAVARAIAAQPPIILADEPTGNLDSKSTKEIMNILKALHAGGRTVIIITHDDEIACQTDRVVRIIDGRKPSAPQRQTSFWKTIFPMTRTPPPKHPGKQQRKRNCPHGLLFPFWQYFYWALMLLPGFPQAAPKTRRQKHFK